MKNKTTAQLTADADDLCQECDEYGSECRIHGPARPDGYKVPEGVDTFEVVRYCPYGGWDSCTTVTREQAIKICAEIESSNQPVQLWYKDKDDQIHLLFEHGDTEAADYSAALDRCHL